jgi:putative SOS response-associated peptidase YedK
MCGRFTLTVDPDQFQESFPGVDFGPAAAPRYNIAPTQPVAVIPNNQNDRLDYFIWGLIPSWAKDPGIGNRLINARADTLAQKPSFRSAYRRRRCLIPASGFYEWKTVPASKTKTPMYLTLASGLPFAFAGLWEIWQSPDGSELLSCTIVTTEPNQLVAEIHNRMPVILPPAAYSLWLDPNERRPEELSGLLKPYPAAEMVAYPVSHQVNSPQIDTPELILPVAG